MVALPSSKPAAPVSKWKEEEGTLLISWIENGVETKPKEIKVKCKRYGNVAIYPSVDNPQLWTAATYNTGIGIARTLKTEDDARRIGEVMWERCKKALCEPTRARIQAMLPVWVGDWLKRCKQIGRFLEPPT
jgi:hypothetical protein